MNRADFQRLAQVRLGEARVLLDNAQYAGAYYLSGYVVECALKACIARQTQQYDLPDRNLVNQSYTHDLTRLINVAGLRLSLDQESNRDPLFAVYWNVVKDWSEESRYLEQSEAVARDLYTAIADTHHGVFQWIQQYW